MKILAVGLLCAVCSFTIFAQTNFNLRQAAAFDARIDNSDSYVGSQLGFSPNENLFFAIDRKNKKLTVWETKSRMQKYSLKGKFEEAEFSPDGKWLAIASEKEITLLNMGTGETHTNLNKYKDEIRFLGWNPNSENFAVGTKDFTVDILDGATGKLKSSVLIHEKKKKRKTFIGRLLLDPIEWASFYYIQAIFTPDGKRFLTNCVDTTAELWNVETGKLISTFTEKHDSPNKFLGAPPVLSEIWHIEISPDGKWIITNNSLWEAETGKKIPVDLSFNFHTVFSPDSRYLGMVNDPNTKSFSNALFDLTTQEIKPMFSEYRGGIAAWSPDGKIFITDLTGDEASRKKAYIWETETGKQLAEIKTYANYCFDFVSTCISNMDIFNFSPNGKVLMMQNEKEVKFLNPQNGEIIFRLSDAQSPAVWSPNGRFLLSKAKEKGKIILFEVGY